MLSLALQQETTDHEITIVMKGFLKRPTDTGEWEQLEPGRGEYRDLWRKRRAPDRLTFVLCSCFLPNWGRYTGF